MDHRISVIIPALDEADGIAAALAPLHEARADGDEIIVVDGGSRDRTPELAGPLSDRVLTSPPGRARQMNAGAAAARGDVLWFLHADTRVPAGALDEIRRAVADGVTWGRFDVRLDSGRVSLALVGRMISLRSRITGVATGDQGIFVRRGRFEELGGYADMPLMEDLELSRRLLARERPACLRGPLVTSARRWERDGVLRTVLLMWRLRMAYYLGADPAQLAGRYRRRQSR